MKRTIWSQEHRMEKFHDVPGRSEEEVTASIFRALKQVFTEHGLPAVQYTDRGSHYVHTSEAGGKMDKDHRTQVSRALHQLGVEHIAAYSPQARGRFERAFGTRGQPGSASLSTQGMRRNGRTKSGSVRLLKRTFLLAFVVRPYLAHHARSPNVQSFSAI